MPTEAAVHEKKANAMNTSGKTHSNLSTPELYEHAVARKEAVITAGGALCARTGKHTARSAQDKFIVRGPSSEKNIWWGEQNVAIDGEKFDALLKKVEFYLSKRDIYVRDCYAGSDPKSRLRVRVHTELAWHSLFAGHMFIKPPAEELAGFSPDFTVICVPGFTAMPQIDGTRGSAFILLNFERRMVLIGGTAYAGEIKKSVFSVMNYLLPLKGIMPMHCSANVGKKGDTAIFFGLSGTGKTTLSSDPLRRLIGDDEHGWSDGGIFNFEGGCYAKVISLNAEAEPQIYAATGRFGAILENVVYDKATRALDLDDGSLTENTRAAYPLEFIDNSIKGPAFPHPKNIVMLTYDAFGVLPPISKLTPEQAMYHFISGYTAKVANTEMGVKEPRAVFSTCFGAPFMSHHPSVYAELLEKKMKRHGAQCWLINTGLCGGPYGVGKRMSIQHTRALLNAALDGKLAKVKFAKDPVFGFGVPARCPGVPPEVLNPRKTWADKDAYDAKLRELAGLFAANFKKFGVTNKAILGAGPRV
ncbi:MAG: phosphoenolpyruvate carboxykinase (ATP) [Elusimicrobiota bacterium]|jgi:phosphoenolpyruvate carboxykinase (ATP)